MIESVNRSGEEKTPKLEKPQNNERQIAANPLLPRVVEALLQAIPCNVPMRWGKALRPVSCGTSQRTLSLIGRLAEVIQTMRRQPTILL
jgi:hypothetical protein